MTEITCNEKKIEKKYTHCKNLRQGEFAIIRGRELTSPNPFMGALVIANFSQKLIVVNGYERGIQLTDGDYLVEPVTKIDITYYLKS